MPPISTFFDHETPARPRRFLRLWEAMARWFDPTFDAVRAQDAIRRAEMEALIKQLDAHLPAHLRRRPPSR